MYGTVYSTGRLSSVGQNIAADIGKSFAQLRKWFLRSKIHILFLRAYALNIEYFLLTEIQEQAAARYIPSGAESGCRLMQNRLSGFYYSCTAV
eukprot:COSAG05_NODE_2539_length_2929_cov_14.539223_4_plen_93_part_00